MSNSESGNQTFLTEFILLGFGDLQELQVLFFLVFLAIYLLTIFGNVLIIVLIVVENKLHSPMYFFLGNLSCLEICYTTAVLPRMLFSFLTGDRTISVIACFTQFYLIASLVSSECCILAVMSYDRYIAICKPLHYSTIMKERLCFSLVAGSWINGFLAMYALLHFMSRLTFCGPNEIDHFFCDLDPLMKLSCSDLHKMQLVNVTLSTLFTLPPFILIITSYFFIITTIVKIPSTTGRKKAFSTCSSHLTVVTIFYGTIIIVYVLPKSKALRELNKVFSACYTFLTPLLNPLIYSLRNREVKEALKKLIKKCSFFVRPMQHQHGILKVRGKAPSMQNNLLYIEQS